MKTHFVLGAIVLVAAGVLASTSAADQPPPAPPHVGVNRAEPRAGHRFVAFIVTPAMSGGVESVHCDATLHANGKTLYSNVRRFFEGPTGGLVAVSCGWKIPAAAHGMLYAAARIENGNGMYTYPAQHWRIKS